MGSGDAYQHQPFTFADTGIQLRMPVDKIPPTEYARLNNAIPLIEGQLQTRGGTTLQYTLIAATIIHSIFRLNQEVLAVVGDRIIGIGTSLYTIQVAPAGAAPVLRSGITFSGNALSIISFRFDADQASWAIIADLNGMMKYRGGVNQGYYQLLGIPAPTTQAIASVGGAGLLNSTGGNPYDWVYTWVNIITNSEGNPSPFAVASGTETKRPTANTNPDPSFGGSGWTNPANAYDSSGVTYANGNTTSVSENTASCYWGAFAATAITAADLNLIVNAQSIVAGALDGATVFGTIYYTLDGGTTWKTIFDTSVSVAQADFTNVIPAGTLYSNIAVRADLTSIGGAASNIPQDSLAGDIRNIGGNLNITSIQKGGGGNRTMELRIYDIRLDAISSTAPDSTLACVNQSANVCVTAPTLLQDPQGQVGFIRLYRRGGSKNDTYYQVGGDYAISGLVAGVCGAGYLTIKDNVPDSSLGASVQLDNDMPVSSVQTQNRHLPYIWGPFDERVLGCGDPDRPGAVYFSKRGNADQWPPQNFVEVSAPSEFIVNGVVYNTRTFAFSMERLYELVPNLIGGVTFTPYPTPCARGLFAAKGLCVAEAIYFVSKDGVYRTTGGQEQSIVENSIKPLFPTLDAPARSVEGYEAVDMSYPEFIFLEFHNGEIWFTYKGVDSGTRQQLIYDIGKQRWRAAQYNVSAVMCYSEKGTVSSLLLGCTDGSFYQTGAATDNGQAIACRVRTGAFDQGQPLNLKQYGDVIFDIDPGGATDALPITITPIINGETVTESAITVTGSGRQPCPLSLGDIYAYNLCFDIAWTATAAIKPIIYQADILWRVDPVYVKHFNLGPTSHGATGYQHVKELWVSLRSNAVVSLTINVDGTDYTYTLASTGGAMQKVYVPMQPIKGLLWEYTFDSTAMFRIYAEDSSVNTKVWQTVNGYTALPILGLDAARGGE